MTSKAIETLTGSDLSTFDTVISNSATRWGPTFMVQQGAGRTIDSFYSGTGDYTTAIQAAFDWAAANKSIVLGIPGKSYAVSSPLTFDHRYASFNGQGCKFVVSHSGIAISFVCPNGGDSFFYAPSRGFEGVQLIGPGKTSVGSQAILFGNASALVKVTSIYIESFETALGWAGNSWCQMLQYFAIFGCKYVLNFPQGLTNAGERISLTHGVFGNCDNGVSVYGAQFQFSHVSFDYITNYAISVSGGGAVYADQCHFEASQDNSEWWLTTGGSHISIDNSVIALTGARTKVLGTANYTDGSRINLGKCDIFVSGGITWWQYSPDYLINGLGTVPFLPKRGPAVGIPTSHSRANLLVDGGFEKGTIYDLTDSSDGAGFITISSTTGDARTGTYGCKIAPTSGRIGRTDIFLDITTGSQPVLVGYWRKIGGGTDVMYVTANFYDDRGGDIGGSYTVTSTSSTYTKFTIEPYWSPVGARYCRIRIGKGASADGASDGTGYMVIDDLTLNCYNGTMTLPTHRPEAFRQRVVSGGVSKSPNPGDTMVVDTTSAAITITLPASPIRGDKIRVRDSAGTFATNNCTVSRNGKTIRGNASDLVMNTNWQDVTFEYNGTTWLY